MFPHTHTHTQKKNKNWYQQSILQCWYYYHYEKYRCINIVIIYYIEEICINIVNIHTVIDSDIFANIKRNIILDCIIWIYVRQWKYVLRTVFLQSVVFVTIIIEQKIGCTMSLIARAERTKKDTGIGTVSHCEQKICSCTTSYRYRYRTVQSAHSHDQKYFG